MTSSTSPPSPALAQTNHFSITEESPIVRSPRTSGGLIRWRSYLASMLTSTSYVLSPRWQWAIGLPYLKTTLRCHHRPPLPDNHDPELGSGRLKPDVHLFSAQHHHLLPPDLPLSPSPPVPLVQLPLRNLRLHLRAAKFHRVNHSVRNVRHFPESHHVAERVEHRCQTWGPNVCVHVVGYSV